MNKVSLAATVSTPQVGGTGAITESYIIIGLVISAIALLSFALSNLVLSLPTQWKRNKKLVLLVTVWAFAFTALLGFADILFDQIVVKRAKISILHFIASLGASGTLLLVAIRTADFNKQIKLLTEQLRQQNDKEIDDRFHSAVQLLGSSETSIQTGAIYCLYHLAIKNEKYCNEVALILCSYIRSKTEKEDYIKQHNRKPSNEIQTAINLLFRDVNGIVGLYKNEIISTKLSKPDLSYLYLAGARFWNAKCQGAIFSSANCNEVSFIDADCQGAAFDFAQLTKAWFSRALMQGVNFYDAHCECVDFREADCRGTVFINAKCLGADFTSAKCQGANFSGAKCQGADFTIAKCQGAYAEKIDSNKLLYFLSARIEALQMRVGKKTELTNIIFLVK